MRGDGQVGDPADGADDRLHRRQAPAGEDERLDEVLGVLGPLVALGLHHDRLQGHEAVGPQQPVAVPEERVVLAPVDGLDHLDGRQLVEGAGEVAVVVVQDRHPVGQALPRHPLGGVGVLLGRDRRGGDVRRRSGGRRARRTRPSRCRSRRPARRVAGRASGRGGPASPWRRPRAARPTWGTRRPSTSSWGRGSARRSRCRGRSAPGCWCGRGACPGGADGARRRSPGPVARWMVERWRSVRRVARLRIRSTVVRSSVSQRPSK